MKHRLTKEEIQHVMSLRTGNPSYTQKKIAQLVGITETSVSRILNGYYYIDDRGKVHIDHDAHKATPDDAFEGLKPKDASFDIGEDGEPVDDKPVKELAQKRLAIDAEEDDFLNYHGMRGMLYEARLCKYAFYILRELKELHNDGTTSMLLDIQHRLDQLEKMLAEKILKGEI